MFFDKKVFILSFVFLCTIFLFFARTACADTHLPYSIDTDITLTADKSPYVLDVPVEVYHANVTIEAGVHIIPSNTYSDTSESFILVQSSMRVLGTEDVPVVFDRVFVQASDRSDLYLNYTTIQEAGHSDGLSVLEDSTLTMEHVTILDSLVGLYLAYNATLHANAIRITHAKNCMMVGYASTSGPDGSDIVPAPPSAIFMHDSTLSNCVLGMYIDQTTKFDFGHNSFIANTHNVQDLNDTTLDFSKNWWGTSAGPLDTVTGVANLTPWLVMDPANARTPVIIVPGILGSVLRKKYDDNTEVWPALGHLVVSPDDAFLNDLSLDDTGQENSLTPMEVGDIVRSIGLGVGPTSHVFDSLIAGLETDGYVEGSSLFVFPYDWRMSDRDTALRLQDFIADVLLKTGQSKVSIIAHSMGGLITKEYASLAGTSALEKIIFIGTPHLGAPKVFKALMYGDDMGVRVGPVSLLHPATIQHISQNMPAVYDLLPSQVYVDGSFNHPYVYDTQSGQFLGYDAIRNFMIDAGRNASLFAQAESLHQTTDTETFGDVPVYDFVGCGATKTVTDFVIKKHSASSDDYMLRYGNGDDTVPVFSATLPGAHTYYVHASSHSELPSAEGVVASIRNILGGQSVFDSIEGITQDSSNCFVGGTVVSKHSPVQMDVYDAGGRHTGPTASGTIEYGIPGVSYDMVGGDAFTFLPTGGEYRVIDTPTGMGTYDFYVQKIAPNDSLVSEKSWLAVPIPSMQSKSQVTITDVDANPDLLVDTDGDGVYEKTYTEPPLPSLQNTVTVTMNPVENTVVVHGGHPPAEDSPAVIKPISLEVPSSITEQPVPKSTLQSMPMQKHLTIHHAVTRRVAISSGGRMKTLSVPQKKTIFDRLTALCTKGLQILKAVRL